VGGCYLVKGIALYNTVQDEKAFASTNPLRTKSRVLWWWWWWWWWRSRSFLNALFYLNIGGCTFLASSF